MSLPVYQHIYLKSSSLEDLENLLRPDMNLKHPVVINVKTLDLDQQREVIGLIENYFVGHNLSFKFPYPLYLVSDHERSISQVPLVNETQELPNFFAKRKSKMNVKESHLSGKNKLLQQEVINSDAPANVSSIDNYGRAHRIIFELEQEKNFYSSILNQMLKAK